MSNVKFRILTCVCHKSFTILNASRRMYASNEQLTVNSELGKKVDLLVRVEP